MWKHDVEKNIRYMRTANWGQIEQDRDTYRVFQGK
jgi:hypothetical protein